MIQEVEQSMSLEGTSQFFWVSEQDLLLVMSGARSKKLTNPLRAELIDLSDPTRGCAWDKELNVSHTTGATSAMYEKTCFKQLFSSFLLLQVSWSPCGLRGLCELGSGLWQMAHSGQTATAQIRSKGGQYQKGFILDHRLATTKPRHKHK